MTKNNSSTNPNRTYLLVGAIALLALCLCVAGGAGIGGYLYFFGGSTPQAAKEPAVEYILDASPRMGKSFQGSTRLELARAVLAEVVRPADTAIAAGLRAFGSGKVPTACKDTDLLVPLGHSNQGKIADMALTIDPGTNSDSALSEAMLAAVRDLAAAKGPHSLVVITGGPDSCNAQAGELIKSEAQRAGIKLEQYVIGFGVDAAETQAIKGMVDNSGGTYLQAPDEATLANIVTAIQAHVDNPSATSVSAIELAATPGNAFLVPSAGNTAVANGTSAPSASPAPSTSSTSNGPSGQSAGATPAVRFGQTACDHPYFPMRPGATWTYSTDQGAQTWTITNVQGDQSNATATVSIATPDGTVTLNWECSPEGIRFFQAINVSGSGANVSMSILNPSGVSILSPDKLLPGASWNYSYTMAWSAAGQSISDQVAETNTVGGIAQTQTSFGSINVMTVNTTQTSQMTTSIGPMSFNGTRTMLLGEGVGILRIDSSVSGHNSTDTLTSYHIP